MLWLTAPVGSMALLMSMHFLVSKVFSRLQVITESPEIISDTVYGVTIVTLNSFTYHRGSPVINWLQGTALNSFVSC